MSSPQEGFPVDSELPVGAQPDVLAADADEADRYTAELEAWRGEWRETLETVREWGPKIAGAYRSARQEVGGTIRREYDDEDGFAPLEGKEKVAHALQPDVLIVDLALHERSWRHPLPGDVDEQVHAAGWTILRREYPAPEEAEETADEGEQGDKPKAAPKAVDILDELDAPAETEEEGGTSEPQTEKKNMVVERVVVTHDGRIVRFIGKSDAPTEPDAPLRFARIRPNKELEEDDPDAYEKQKTILTEYKEGNDDKFVQPDKMRAVAVLRPDTIDNADLNQLPDDAPDDAEDHELQAWMLRQGLADFLAKRDLASTDYIDTLRS
jgi:hypothetical protein